MLKFFNYFVVQSLRTGRSEETNMIRKIKSFNFHLKRESLVKIAVVFVAHLPKLATDPKKKM